MGKSDLTFVIKIKGWLILEGIFKMVLISKSENILLTLYFLIEGQLLSIWFCFFRMEPNENTFSDYTTFTILIQNLALEIIYT